LSRLKRALRRAVPGLTPQPRINSRQPATISAAEARLVVVATSLWSDTFAVPGSRTTGNCAQQILLAGPGWQGEVRAAQC